MNFNPPKLLTLGPIRIAGESVTWNQMRVPGFAQGRLRNELALLCYLVNHPNRLVEYNEIVKNVFPDLISLTPDKCRYAVNHIKARLAEAFKFIPSFNALLNAPGRGYIWRVESKGSALVTEVGNTRVTTDEVFWKDKFVPGFGPEAQKKRRALLLLLDDVNKYVSTEDLAAEAEDENIMVLLEEIKNDFYGIDPHFRALSFDGVKGFRWSELKSNSKSR